MDTIPTFNDNSTNDGQVLDQDSNLDNTTEGVVNNSEIDNGEIDLDPVEDNQDELDPQDQNQVIDDEDGGEVDNSVQEKIYEFKANGVKIKCTEEELLSLASKGVDYTRNSQRLAKDRKKVDLINNNNLSIDDLNMLIAMKSGDKKAVNSFLENVGFTYNDIENSNGYKPKSYDANISELESIAKEIYNTEPQNTINQINRFMKHVDDGSMDILHQNPRILNTIVDHINTGHYQEILPEAIKKCTLYGVKFIDAYKDACIELHNKENARSRSVSSKPKEQVVKARRQANITGKNNVQEPLNEYQEFITKMQNKAPDDITDAELEQYLAFQRQQK